MVNQPSRYPLFNHPSLLALLLFFLAMGFQLLGIDTLSLTSDECFSIYHSQMSPRLIYHHLSTGNNPPLYEWILHYWMGLFGDSAFSVRFLSVLFSSLTTALIFILGTKIFVVGAEPTQNNQNVGLGITASSLFLASNYSTFLAHEARTYNLTLFLGVWSTLLFISAIRSQKITHFLAYGLTGGLLCLSHFFGAWILMGHSIFWLWQLGKSRPEWRLMVWAVMGFGVAFGWYLPNLWHRFVDSASQGTWVNPAPWDAPYFTLWKYLNTPIATLFGILLLLYLTFIVLRKSDAAASRPATQTSALFLWLFAFPFFGLWLMSLDHPLSVPMFTERYASVSLPFLSLSLASALSSLKARFSKRIFVIAPLSFFLLLWEGKMITPPNQASAKESLKTVEKTLGERCTTTPIVLEPYHAAFQVLYYADHARFQQYHPYNIYDHLARQLQQSNIWILRTNKSLDSLGLSQKKSMAYLHFGAEKSDHTKEIEEQLNGMTKQGGTISTHEIRLPKSLWGCYEISHEAEFWLIEKK
jgi:uncharacterized membrane protein